MKHSVAALVSIAVLAGSMDSVAQTVNAVESISSSQFLKLPDGIKAVYVGGVLDGMTYASYNSSLPHHDQLVRCARALTLGSLAQKTAEVMRATPPPDVTMATAVAKALGAYCKEKALR